MNPPLINYHELLDFYTGLTSEKEKLANFIFNFLPKNRDTYLDIGAGNGELMSYFKNEFKYLAAIESNKKFSKDLKLLTNNINWGKIEDIVLYEKFDFILVSHVLGYISNELKPHVIKKIFKMLNTNGVLVLIYNSIKSDIYKILDIIKNNTGINSSYSKTIIDPSVLKGNITSPFIAFDTKLTIRCSSENCIKNIINFLAFNDLDNANNKYEILNNTIRQFNEKSNLWTINVVHEFLVVSNDSSIIKKIKDNYLHSY